MVMKKITKITEFIMRRICDLLRSLFFSMTIMIFFSCSFSFAFSMDWQLKKKMVVVFVLCSVKAVLSGFDSTCAEADMGLGVRILDSTVMSMSMQNVNVSIVNGNIGAPPVHYFVFGFLFWFWFWFWVCCV